MSIEHPEATLVCLLKTFQKAFSSSTDCSIRPFAKSFLKSSELPVDDSLRFKKTLGVCCLRF